MLPGVVRHATRGGGSRESRVGHVIGHAIKGTSAQLDH